MIDCFLKAVIQWSIAGMVVASLTLGAQAQTADGGESQASVNLMQKMDAGVPQDLIVVYDDKAIEAETRVMQTEQRLPAHHPRIRDYKADHYASRKQNSLMAMSSQDAEVVKDFSHLPANLVRVHSRQALERLLAQPGVAGVFENRIEQKMLAQSLPLVGQPQVAAQGNIGAGTSVAVLDTGVDYTKTAFGSCTAPGVPASCKVVYAKDFAPSDGKLDSDGHGTNVAGIVAGVAPGTKIIALDVFGAGGTANSSDILSAISWVIANKSTYNIVAMNLSLGSGKFTSTVTNGIYNTAVAQARAAGILTIAAAGNDGYTNSLSQPAATTGVVSVGAVYDSSMGGFNWGSPLRCTDKTSAADKVTCFSNSAPFLTLLAPGSQILAAGITEGGTSQAAPHVAGAVAVLRAAFPSESLDQTVARLSNGVMVTDSRNDIAKPRLNLPLALGVTAACSYSLSEISHTFDSNSASASLSVSSATGCDWHAASNASDSSWMAVTVGSNGSGNGTVSYSVTANPNVTARTGTLTVAGQTFTVTQSGAVGNFANILLNPGFEDGAVSWVDQTANGYPVITSYMNPVSAANSWYAWLCGYNNCTDTLYQDITIPADSQNAYLQFSYQVQTTETSSSTAYDAMTVRIYSPASARTYSTLASLSNLNATADPVQSPQYDLSAYKGQTLRIQFSATADATFATDFLLDDVHVMVTGSAPDTQPPTVPGGLSAAAISTSTVNLAWSVATDNVAVTAYKLYRDGALLVSIGNVLTYSDTGLLAGTSHSYAVAACDAAGNCSAQSLVAVAITPTAVGDTQAPTVPVNFNGTATSVSAIKLSWSAATDNIGVTQYKVYRNGTLLAALGKVSGYTDSGLTPSTAYSYTVAACDAAGNCSAQSSAVSVSTLFPFDSSAPLIIDGAVSVNWSGNVVNISIENISNRSYSMTSGSLRIELWAFDTPFTGSELGYKTASIRTTSITGGLDRLAPRQSLTGLTLSLPYTAPPAVNTHYVIFVTEYSATCSLNDKFCYAYYVNLYESQPPTAPTGLIASTVGSSQINLAWTASSDNVGVATYKVYRNGNLLTLLGNVTGYSDPGLAASTHYSYTVAACDAVGNCSAQSTVASATTQSAPDTQSPSVPTGLTATALGSSQVKLVWTAASDNVGVTAYKIYSSAALVVTLDNVTSTTRVTVPSTTYRYTVSACDAAGNCSAQSAAASVTTPALADTTAPTVPSGLSATSVSNTTINLVWTAATDNVGVTGYRVYRTGSLLATLGNVTSYTDTGLRGATAYSYTVQACDALANCSDQSTAALATTPPLTTTTTTTTTTSTTVTTTTTTTVLSETLSFSQGWNLVGNGTQTPIQVATSFADLHQFVTIWKWDATQSVWGFYAPALAAQGGTVLTDYASSKGYQLLSSVAAGEGFWVNAAQVASISLPAITSITASDFQDGRPLALKKGWNLIAIGNALTPSAFNRALSASPPAVGVVPLNLTTLWAWDNLQAKWYFYAPNLEAQGGTALTDYIANKGYFDFTATHKLLGPGVGFWVNKP